MKSRTSDLVFALVLLAICGVLFVETLSGVYAQTGLGTAYNAVFYPRILLAGLALLSLGVIAQALLTAPRRLDPALRRHGVPVGGTLLLTILYGVLFIHVPFVPGAAVYCAAVGLVLGYRRLLVLTATSLAVPLVLHLVFESLLGVRLP